MQIKIFFILALTGIFLGFTSHTFSASLHDKAMGEFYHGESRGRMARYADSQLKFPYNFRNAPVIESMTPSLKPEREILTDDVIIPRQIGFARVIDDLSAPESFRQVVTWQPVPEDGGHAAALILVSPNARALRAGILVNKLPGETEFRFLSAADHNDTGFPPVPVTGEHINYLLQLNRNLDPDHPDAGTYWSPIVPGDRLGIEMYLPPGIEPENVEIFIPFLSHIDVWPLTDSNILSLQDYGDSNSCQNDVVCYPDWQNPKNAVAKMIFTQSGSSYTCSGTLLNDTDTSTYRPYFITANHCIGTQTVASTLQTLWFFESSSCDGTTQSPAYTTRNGGAELLWAKEMTYSNTDENQDITFLELNDPPPPGTFFSGWSVSSATTAVTGIHHPKGDWKKISFGERQNDYTCYYTGGTSYSCNPSLNGSFFRILWSDGGTESGSSGSGIFNSNGQLIGTLLGGIGTCEGSESDYSKFGTAYAAGNLSQWLNPPVNCTYGISSYSGSFPADGGTDTITVTPSDPGCAWTASESLSWVSLSRTSGVGTLDLTITVTANAGSARNGVITIAGETYTVTQAAAPLPDLMPYKPGGWSAPIVAAEKTGTTIDDVLDESDTIYIDWAIKNDSSADAQKFSTALHIDGVQTQIWNHAGLSSYDHIQVFDHAIGRLTPGAHTLKIVADIYGEIPEAGETDNEYTKNIYVNPSCDYSISPSSADVSAAGGAIQVTVTPSSSSCSWTTDNPLDWIDLSPQNGNGSGSVTVSVTANTGGARTGTLTIAEQAFEVSQQTGIFTKTTVLLSNTTPNHTVSKGVDATIYGTSAANRITIEQQAHALLIHFPGENRIEILADTSGFTVSRSGAVVIFEGADGTLVRLPATRAAQTIVFNDRTHTLLISGSQVMLNDQVITTTPAEF